MDILIGKAQSLSGSGTTDILYTILENVWALVPRKSNYEAKYIYNTGAKGYHGLCGEMYIMYRCY